MPEVVIVDEIGSEAEALACRTIAERGVQLIATAHGRFLENLIKNPTLADLVRGPGWRLGLGLGLNGLAGLWAGPGWRVGQGRAATGGVGVGMGWDGLAAGPACLEVAVRAFNCQGASWCSSWSDTGGLHLWMWAPQRLPPAAAPLTWPRPSPRRWAACSRSRWATRRRGSAAPRRACWSGAARPPSRSSSRCTSATFTWRTGRSAPWTACCRARCRWCRCGPGARLPPAPGLSAPAPGGKSKHVCCVCWVWGTSFAALKAAAQGSYTGGPGTTPPGRSTAPRSPAPQMPRLPSRRLRYASATWRPTRSAWRRRAMTG
jgi:hypothetical protein